MAAAAAAAAGPTAGDPPVHLNATADQDPFRYMDLCERAFQYGDFSYVQVALRANHLGLSKVINNRVTAGQTEVSNAEAFQMLRMAQKSNSMILARTMRNAALERDARRLVERVTGLETNSEVQEKILERFGQITEAIKGTHNKHGGNKPISEFKALQALKNFTGERSKFRDWNDKFLYALAQVKPSYRKAIKLLNKKAGYSWRYNS